MVLLVATVELGGGGGWTVASSTSMETVCGGLIWLMRPA